jgi:hypothetical protein
MADKGEQTLASLASRILDIDHMIQKDQPPPVKKFRTVTTEDEQELIDGQKNRNTKKKTEIDVKLLTTWLESEKKEFRKPEEIPPEELDRLLANFILSVKPAKKDEYEPESLVSKYNSIGRYLRDHKYTTNINQDEKFQHSRDILIAKKKSLKSMGYGSHKNKADPFSASDISRLKEMKLLGAGNYQYQ